MPNNQLKQFVLYGDTAARLAYVPDPPANVNVSYMWYDTDDKFLYAWDGSDWNQCIPPGSIPPPSNGAVQTSFLVSGGSVIWLQNYDFQVTAAQYYIQGLPYSSPLTNISLDASDPTNARIDVIAVDDTGTVIKITGTPSANPSEPFVNPGTQLKLAIILVPALSTQPPTATNTTLYFENAGSPTEWIWTNTGASINVNSAVNPKAPATKDIEVTSAVSGHFAQGVIPSGTFNPSTASQLVLSIRSKATWANNRGFAVTLRNNNAIVGQTVNINRTGSFGFDSSVTGSYQTLGIPISNFGIPANTTITQIRITAFGNGHGCYIADIFFQASGTTPSGGSGISQADADARYLKQASNLSDVASVAAATAALNAMVGDSGAGGTKGMVPAPAAGDAAANKFLKANGSWAVPSGSGITELTGDVTAGPGSGSQAATLANTAVTPGSYTNANITVDSKGRITAAANGSGGSGSGGGGDWVFLGSQQASSSAQLDFAALFSSLYEVYVFEFEDILPATSTDDLRVRMGTGGGPTYDTGANYKWALDQSSQLPNAAQLGSDTAAPANQVFMKIGHSLGNGSTNGFAGQLVLYNPQSTTTYKKFISHAAYIDSAGNFLNERSTGQYTSTTAVTGIRFYFSTGNIASGVIRMYGIRKNASGSATRAITCVIDGGGSAITTGIKADVSVPYACTITGVRMLADQSGSAVVDIWKDTYANYPPVVGDSITAAAKPTISAAIKSEDTTLTGWTTSISAGDTLRFNVDSAATITRLTLTLTVTV